jgi:hypothetical protein
MAGVVAGLERTSTRSNIAKKLWLWLALKEGIVLRCFFVRCRGIERSQAGPWHAARLVRWKVRDCWFDQVRLGNFGDPKYTLGADPKHESRQHT